ncbi:MAG: 50S ribosomal protein L10 [Candidatus Marinimicrobia bacterium]|nr:50S ribosomal protein L10 [Candidatus Neomarinimicrobiota bacterium]MCF7827463.1 50S ribosomal protein L10 [Candidatus Neomarinimicrobiota bacterium]MCF7882424.1 50S ribosomal protein L10 [Candidatus Neomarinimicrobiota bacterium]
MPSAEKEQFVAEIQEKFAESSGIYFTDFLGLNVEQVNDLRSKFFEASVEYKVVKNRLTKISAKEAGYDNVDDLLTGPTAIAFTKDDPVAPAKILTDFAKENEQISLKGGIFEGERIELDRMNAIANLPSHEELLQKLLGGLQSPMRNLVSTLNASMQNLTFALAQLKEQKNQ